MPGCVMQIFESFVPILERDHIVAFLFQNPCNHLAVIGVIIHHKDERTVSGDSRSSLLLAALHFAEVVIHLVIDLRKNTRS